jgi:hypothetical protein
MYFFLLFVSFCVDEDEHDSIALSRSLVVVGHNASETSVAMTDAIKYTANELLDR